MISVNVNVRIRSSLELAPTGNGNAEISNLSSFLSTTYCFTHHLLQ